MKEKTLNSHERIKSRKTIDSLLSTGATFHYFPVRVLYQIVPQSGAEPLKVAVAVSKRKFKHAVDRNRLKRQIRENWRIRKEPLRRTLAAKGLEMSVMLIFSSKDVECFDTLCVAVNQSISRLVTEVNNYRP